MNLELVFALARSFERLGIVAVAGLSIWAGYRLFRLVTESQASAEVEGHGVKLTLINVGPGVFFALFGSLVLIYAISTPLEIGPMTGTQENDRPVGYRFAHGFLDQNSNVAAVAAINHLKIFSDSIEVTGKLSDEEQLKFASYVSDLSIAKECLIDQEFESGTYAEYLVVLGMCEKNPKQCDTYLKAKNKMSWFKKVNEFSSIINLARKEVSND